VTKDIDPVNFYLTTTIGELIVEYVSNKVPGEDHETNVELRKSTII
jgi:3-isopropylmalate dehydrogenase